MLPATIDGQTARIERLERELRQVRLQVRELQGRLYAQQVMQRETGWKRLFVANDQEADPMEHLSHD